MQRRRRRDRYVLIAGIQHDGRYALTDHRRQDQMDPLPHVDAKAAALPSTQHIQRHDRKQIAEKDKRRCVDTVHIDPFGKRRRDSKQDR